MNHVKIMKSIKQKMETMFKTHRYRQCPAYGQRCGLCSGFNYYVRACRNRRNVRELQETENQGKNKANRKMMNAVSAKEVNLNNYADKEWDEVVTIKDSKVRCKLDTSGQVNILPKRVYDTEN